MNNPEVDRGFFCFSYYSYMDHALHPCIMKCQIVLRFTELVEFFFGISIICFTWLGGNLKFRILLLVWDQKIRRIHTKQCLQIGRKKWQDLLIKKPPYMLNFLKTFFVPTTKNVELKLWWRQLPLPPKLSWLCT